MSLCSGIEAASVAWHPLGWEPVAFSEIEPFPDAVLARRWPQTPNLGDMTKFKEWPDDLRPDLLVGGTPCQSFSVAGLRKGLEDPRGQLALVYLAIANRYHPRWILWENVPGVLSADDGRAFGSFLGGLAELGYGWAYRVLDAQYFGVAQRRRRVFVVGYLGDWRRAAAVLFEPESVRGHPAPRRQKGQGASGTVAPCLEASGDARTGQFLGTGGAVVEPTPCLLTMREGQGPGGRGPLVQKDVSATLATGNNQVLFHLADGQAHANVSQDLANTLVSSCEQRGGIIMHAPEISPTLAARDFKGPSLGTALVTSIRTNQPNANGHGVADDVAHTLACDAKTGQAVVIGIDGETNAHEELMGCLQAGGGGGSVALIDTYNQTVGGEVAGTLQAGGPNMAIALQWQKTGMNPQIEVNATLDKSTTPAVLAGQGTNGRNYGQVSQDPRFSDDATDFEDDDGLVVVGDPTSYGPGQDTTGHQGDKVHGEGDVWNTLAAQNANNGGGAGALLHERQRVRRLTPRECERLQGFPDNYTRVPFHGHMASDGPRYKTLGNSMAVPVMRWIGQRIQAVEDMNK